MVLISSSPAMAFFMYTKEWDIKSTMEDKVAPSSNSRKKKELRLKMYFRIKKLENLEDGL